MARVKTPPRRPLPPLRAGHRFGSHLSVAGGLHRAAAEARRLGFSTVQVFVKNQRQWHAPPLTDAQVAAWRAAREAAGLAETVAHASYLINLASPDEALRERSRRAFALELERCDALGIPYLVIHPGATLDGPPAAGIARVAAALNRIFADHPGLRTMPLLETTAGQGSTLGRTVEELGAILAELGEPGRAGVCIDTCHVFAAGYDIRSRAGYEDLMAAVERHVGIERVRCWHLNDSRGALGARVDRHEHIGRGRIGPAGFAHVLGDRAFRATPMILETPKDEDGSGRLDRQNLRRLIELEQPA
jgi:deoxyribonuclease-4